MCAFVNTDSVNTGIWCYQYFQSTLSSENENSISLSFADFSPKFSWKTLTGFNLNYNQKYSISIKTCIAKFFQSINNKFCNNINWNRIIEPMIYYQMNVKLNSTKHNWVCLFIKQLLCTWLQFCLRNSFYSDAWKRYFARNRDEEEPN